MLSKWRKKQTNKLQFATPGTGFRYRDGLPCVAALAEEDRDAVLFCTQEPKKSPYHGDCNSGFLYARRSSLPLINAWIERMNSTSFDHTKGTHGDQSQLNGALRFNAFKSRLRYFDASMVGMCGIGGTFARHYNCPRRGKSKISHMKENNEWLVFGGS